MYKALLQKTDGGTDIMKKRMTGMMLAAAVTVLGASAVFADGVDVKGVRFEIPDEISELVTVRTDGLEEGELEQFLVYLKTTHHDYMYV